MTGRPEVLVLRALGLGDLLTVVPALRGLRRARPADRLVLATAAALAPLARHTGAVDEVIDARPLAALPARAAGAALAVNLHGRGPQSTALLRATGPERLISYGVTARWRPDEHEVARWCRLLDEAGVPCDPGDLLLATPRLPSPAPGAVVLHPGAAHGSRRWPVPRWATVAAALAAGGQPVVVSGSAAEQPLAHELAARAGLAASTVLAGRTGVPQLAALVAAAPLLISGDTGVAHLATAFGTPSVVLFGPTPPALWGPPPDRPRHRVLWAGRTGDPQAEVPDPGLLEITPAAVLAAADAALRSAAR